MLFPLMGLELWVDMVHKMSHLSSISENGIESKVSFYKDYSLAMIKVMCLKNDN